MGVIVVKNKIICVIFLIGLFLILVGGYFFTKFKDATVELGSEISSKDFIRYGISSNVLVDLSNVKDSVGEYDVKLKYLLFDYNKKLKIVDTTPPKLELKDIYMPLNYSLNIDDFIVKLEDISETSISFKEKIDISDYGDYKINIIAVDKYNNKTEKECTLSIGWVKKEFSVEVGNEIKISDLLYDMKNKDTINAKELEQINKEREGIYHIKSVLNGCQF